MSQINFEKKILKNGLTVIYHSDPNTPFVVVNTLYKVGSKNELHHKTGFAHLFEHLMFEGTPNIPYFDGPLQEAGGENNAFTNNDYTNYYDFVPATNAEIPFWMEADRMQNLKINATSLKLQKKVVIEEFKENYINQPYGDIQHILRTMVYQKHPYQWPTIGKDIGHIKDATLKEVKDFYHQYYSPNNAILVVAGNIESDKTFELVEKWFSDIPTQNQSSLEIAQEPIQTSAREKTHLANVPENMIILAFQMPGRLEKGYFEGDLITDILSSGPSSRLEYQLVKERALFSDIDAYITGSIDTGMFVIEGRIHNGIDIQVAKDAIWEELKNLQENDISDIELEKVKNQMLTYMRFSDASLLNKAISLAYYEMLGNAQLINEEADEYENISKEDIRDFAKKYLNFSQSNTLYYLSKA
ncbi:MAG TPA: pitrilysin family protein [Chitinophagales bacterium]|nr:pitrilysin family protein [Chitinophagales bacterium]